MAYILKVRDENGNFVGIPAIKGEPGDLKVASAKPGQLLLVKSVDDNGKPTEWETVDRTHWSEMAFNGDMSGLEAILVVDGMYAVKVSSEYVTTEAMVGSVVTLNVGGTDQSVQLSAENVVDATDALGVPGSLVFWGNQMCALSLPANSTIQGALFPAGTWFMYNIKGVYVKSLSCMSDMDTEIIHKLDNKYIDAEWMATTVTWKGAVVWAEEERLSGSNGENQAIYINNMEFSLNAGATYIVAYNGMEYECACSSISNGELILGNLSIGQNADGTPFGANTGEPFLLGVLPSENLLLIILTDIAEKDPFTMGIYEAVQVPAPIPEKYLPKSVAKLPEGGTPGQILALGDDGNLVWANPSASAAYSNAEEVSF